MSSYRHLLSRYLHISTELSLVYEYTLYFFIFVPKNHILMCTCKKKVEPGPQIAVSIAVARSKNVEECPLAGVLR